MNFYQLAAGAGIDALRKTDRQRGPLHPHSVRLRLQAAALDFRDVMIAEAKYWIDAGKLVAPLSDGAGDKAIPTFWPAWIDGAREPFHRAADAYRHFQQGCCGKVVIDIGNDGIF